MSDDLYEKQRSQLDEWFQTQRSNIHESSDSNKVKGRKLIKLAKEYDQRLEALNKRWGK